MAKTASEMSTFFAEEAMNSSAILDLPKVRNTPFLLELNMRQAAQNYLMSALLDWRHQFADPRPKLRLAFDACASALETLPKLDSPTPLPSRFRFCDVVFLAKLIDIDVPITCVPLLQTCRASTEIDSLLDCALAETIVGTDNVLGPMIAKGSFTKRQNLLKETYATYLELLLGNADSIQRAETNFKERRTDSYYSGGLQIDGGGLDNSHVVDYRLACIIKTTGIKTDTIHALH